MRLSVVVPTRGRPHDLARCLRALARQTRPPDEVLVAVRDDDLGSAAAVVPLAEFLIGLRIVTVGDVGASEARNRCLDVATGVVVAFTDDDAAPHPEWLARIEARFASDPALGALGGPDWIEGRVTPVEARPRAVGLVQWWGRTVGNHHLGCRTRRPVAWLKGANLSIRRAALGRLRFGRLLRGRAAQFAEDFALSTAVGRGGWRVLYDPEVAVDHFPGPLVGGVDHRSLADREALADASHNETVALLEYLPPGRRAVYLAWAALIGTRLLPGALLALVLALSSGSLTPVVRSLVVLRGRGEGWRTWRAAVSRSRPAREAAGAPTRSPASLIRRHP